MVKQLVLCAAMVATCAFGSVSYSQQADPIKRTIVQRVDYPGDKMATLLVMIEVIPNGFVARHTHPGAEVAMCSMVQLNSRSAMTRPSCSGRATPT